MSKRYTFSLVLLVVGLAAGDVAGEWTKQQQDLGYVVFGYTPMKNLSRRYKPAPDAVTTKLSCVLARDEYESIQFGIHAIGKPLEEITVTVESDLKVTVYHRVKQAIRQQLLNLPGNDGIPRWVPDEVHLQRGNVFDTVEGGDSVNFWLTVRADTDTPAGRHLGKIRIQPAGKPATVVDLDVTVRSFALQRPRAAFGIWMREDMLPKRFGGVGMPDEIVLAIYRDMAAHGHNSNWFYPTEEFEKLQVENNHALEKLLPLAHEAGLLDPRVPSLIAGGIPDEDRLPGQKLNTAVTWLQSECRRRGWPELIVFGPDEPKYPGDDITVRRSMEPMRRVPMRTNIDQASVPAAYGYMTPGLCDVQNVMDGLISPEMKAEANRLGMEIWTYSFRIWREDMSPLRERFFAGLYTWTHRLKGNWVWAYDNGHHRHAWFAPDSTEPMPITGHEGRREGIDDYRYLQMLEDGIAANPQSDTAIEARTWLTSLRDRLMGTIPNIVFPGKPLTIAEYDEIRSRAADYIQRLGPVASDSTGRPSVTAVKAEEVFYRGKSLSACIAGLAADDVATRRAAAWALYEMGPQAAPATMPLARALSDPEVRMPALHALEAIGPDAYKAVPQIAALVTHVDPFVRIGAALTLGEIGCPMQPRNRSGRRVPSPHAPLVIEPLSKVLVDEFDTFPSTAASILGAMGPLAKPVVPTAIAYLDNPSHILRSAGLEIITGLGPHASDAVPKLMNIGGNEFKEGRIIVALAAIGPAASAAVGALEVYAEKNTGDARANAFYALCTIRGDLSDLQKMTGLLQDPKVDAAAKRHVVKLLKQLGAKAKPVAHEIRPMLNSPTFSDLHEDLQIFFKYVQDGKVPGIGSDE
jgi:hypothetical protein